MGSQTLHVGTLQNGKPFLLPADLGDKKIAMLAQSKKGKTYGLGVILEELCRAKRPFIATDPANNLYGLRVLPDGSPSGLEVVIIGGDHADIPFEKDAGERMAEALLVTPICAVIDVAMESKGSLRRFMTDFAGRLMRSKPEIPRVIFLEEAPVLIPQNAFGVQAQVCKDAVAALATVGGNFGYGVVAASQRAATLDKNVLSQCEALIVMGMTHNKDRKAVREWMEAKDIGESAAAAFAELGSLKPGEAWYWSPGDDRFERFTFLKRETLHPREMQKLGLKSSAVHLGDMHAFVERMKKDLTKTLVDVPRPEPKRRNPILPPVTLANQEIIDRLTRENDELKEKVRDLHEKLSNEKKASQSAERRLAGVREALRGQYDAMRNLFEQLPPSAAGGDRGPYMKWLEKAPKSGIKSMLEHLIENGSATRQQLATIAGVAKSTGYDYVGWILRNQLAQDSDGKIVLRGV